MNQPETILRALADGEFCSGEALAERCGITRAAVWKQIERLRDHYGLDVQAVKGRGYRLENPLEWLDEDLIVDELSPQGRFLLQRLDILFETDSTNQYLMSSVDAETPSGDVCFAEFQSAGRGRRGRNWVSPLGGNLYLSIRWEYPFGPARLSGLSLVAGLAVVRALRRIGARRVGLKWPNDLLWQGRKLAGLLVEVKGEQAGPVRIVLGVGVNLMGAPRMREAIDQPWADLKEIIGGDEPLPRNRIAANLLDELLISLARFETEGLEPYLDEWRRSDLFIDRPVTLMVGDRRIEGIHRGIDASGALILEHEGERRLYHGGEVSLRG